PYFAFSRPVAQLAIILATACAGGGSTSLERAATASGEAGALPAATASAAAAAGTPGATIVPTATAVLPLTPRPGAPIVDLGVAQRLESEGDLTNALDAYLSLTQPGNVIRATGILGEARVLLAMDRPGDARAVLEPYLQDNTSADAAPGHYLLGRAYAALKLSDLALAQFDAYVQSGRPAAPYAQYDRALALLDLCQPMNAALAAQNGLATNLPAAAKRSFMLLVAQSYERA